MTPKSQRTPRAHERKESWAVCQVALETGPVREGVLLDMSDGGARVRFRTRGQLPERVRVKASRYGLNRKAIVVWQDIFDAGLRFVDD